MADDKPFYISRNRGFLPPNPADDFLHPKKNSLVSDAALTETQYFGFSVPQHSIHAIGYLWHHPNLRVVTGGVCVFQGVKRTTLEAELCDLRGFMSDDVLAGDLHDYTLVNGYRVRVLEPLKRFALTYTDQKRNHSVDLQIEALMPPVVFEDGNHFDQAMRVKGKLVLRGTAYDVDCYNVRDRSWGKPRREEVLSLPPMSWVTAVFDDGFALNCTVMDQAAGNPELKGRFELPDDATLSCGWIQKDGKTGCLVKARKRVQRNPQTFVAERIDLEMEDDLGRKVHMQGTLVAACPYPQSLNISTVIGLMRWESDGKVAYGDCQEAFWNDYLTQMSARNRTQLESVG